MIPVILLIAIAVSAACFFSGQGKKKQSTNEPIHINAALLEQHILFCTKSSVEEKNSLKMMSKSFWKK